MSEKKKISIGVPCYNEEENIELMYQALTKQMSALPQYEYEILFADNNSNDHTPEIMKRLAIGDKHVKVIINQTNFGPERSGINCSKHASGDAYIWIPCDFQEPPEMIPRFLEEWEKGHDIVFGQKIASKENKVKFFCRKVFYSIINAMSDRPQLEQTTGFGLLDRKVLDILLVTQVQDPEFNTRNLICEYGFNIILLPYEQQKRKRGVSSYSMSSYFHFAITSLVNTSVKPLHIMTVLGILVAFGSICVGLFYFIYKLTHWYSFTVGIAPAVIGLFFVAAVQLFCIGMLGEYIAVIVRRVTNRPLVVEKELINFDEEDEEHGRNGTCQGGDRE